MATARRGGRERYGRDPPGAIAVELGISEKTAERWPRTAASAGLLPVRVVDRDHGSAESRLSAVVVLDEGIGCTISAWVPHHGVFHFRAKHARAVDELIKGW